ncbi:site-specific integrase [Labilibaculum sp.]|uniref:site-specific integrase n=1 Tax=Labilibaculum sp. TaxID=2060723 RepID=UPI002AA87404|nr:site-specific integrase [Labilibaculum sp.]
MNTFTPIDISFVIRKSKSKSNLESPIYIRISVENERVEISTGRSISSEDWNNKAGKANARKKGGVQLNKFLDVLKNNIFDHHTEMIKNSELVTAKKLKLRFLGKDEEQRSLLQVFEYHNKQMHALIGITFAKATTKRYDTTLDHIRNFLKHQYKINDIPLRQIKYSFITDLEHYFKTVRKCNHNSSLKYIKNFRKVINLALKNEWLDKDPFAKYQAKLVEVKREFITKEELQRLENLKIKIKRLDMVRDMFVFACYSGLAYIDISNLTTDNIRIGIDGYQWIIMEREKTKTPSNLPLLPKAAELVKKYEDFPGKKTEDHIFPNYSNQKLNAYLKELADLTSIDKNITFHIARHTFATTVTLANGVPIESISSMLGHKSIRTTQIYSKVINEKVSKDMNKLKKMLK